LVAAVCIAAPLWAQEPGTWVPIADLSQARAGHTATLLANGTVLIAGGKDIAGRPLASAEIYDPTTGVYTGVSAVLPTAVWGHTAILLNDGTVFIAGGNGDGGQPVADVQLFDPSTATFSRAGYMSTARSLHTATLLGDGRVLLAGGNDGASAVSRLELYDPVSGVVSPAPSALLEPRESHTATLLSNGQVLIAGGSNASGTLATAELYDPSSGTVTSAGALGVARTAASAALLLDGTVLVAGGESAPNVDLDTAEIYDPGTNTFTPLSTRMAASRSGHTSVPLLHNGRVLIAGGTNGGQLVASAEVYDPITGAFLAVESPITARQLFGANFFDVPYSGMLLATGGIDSGGTPLASSEKFFYPTLRSDKPDYTPGDTVTLMGESWRPNEIVTINVHPSNGAPDTPLVATADDHGAFTNSDFFVDAFDGGVTFLATATGQSSRWTAQTTFTDHPGNTPHSTSTAVTCSAANVPVNSTVTCTATVTDTSSAPGNRVNPPGTVSFTSSKSGTFAPASCALTPVASTNNQSSCSVTFTPTETGTHTITASYSGGVLIGHGPGGQNVPINPSSGTFTLAVFARTTSTTLDCPDSTSTNSPLNCTVTVTDTAGGTKSAPEGTVAFTVSGPSGATVTPNPCTLVPSTGSTSSCTASFNASQTGSYTITANYSPAPGTIHASSSGSDTVAVTTRTTTTTVDCPASTAPNSPTTCTVTVTDTASGTKSAPQGTVSFSTSGPTGSNSSVTPNPCALTASTSSTSSCTVSFTADQTGSYTITGNYSPAAASTHASSTGSDTVDVSPRTTTTTVDCPASTAPNSPLTCTVTVTDTASGTRSAPLGTVGFAISGPAGSTSSVTPNPCALVATTASSSSCTVSFSADQTGSYTITGTYSPAAGSIHGGSSGTDTVDVIARTTTTTVDCPASTPANSPATCTVTVTDTASGTKSAPLGTVGFSVTGPAGSTPTITPNPCALTPNSSNTSTCTVSFNADKLGSYTITGTYTPAAASVHASSSGSPSIQVIARTTTTAVDCPPSTPANSPLACTVTVTDTASGTKTAPLGTVGFSTSGPAGSTSTVTPNPCTLAPTGSSTSTCMVSFNADKLGSYTITGTYTPAAGSIHAASSGSDTVQVIARTTTTTVDCPASTPANSPAMCTVTVTDVASGTKSSPLGSVGFTTTGGPAGSSSSITPNPCTLAPSSGSASSCMVTFNADRPGSYTVTGSYSPAADSIHAASTGVDTIEVVARTTSTTVDCPDATPANSPAMCTVTVTDIASGTKSPPLGTVAFSVSGGPAAGSTSSVTPNPCDLTASSTSSSSCTVSFNANVPGSYTITATYRPASDSIHSTSSGSDTVTVTKRSTMTTVDCTPPTVPAGVSTTCTATVTDNETGTPITPTGTVSFTSNGSGSFSPAASCTLTGAGPTATCSVTYTPAPVGSNETQTITAIYGGDATHNGSSATTTVIVLALSGKVTGGGQVDVDRGRASFGFVVQRKETGGLATGQLEYHNHVSRLNVHSLGMLTLLIVDNTATFSGTCRVNDTTPCTFRVTVQDNGEPGSQGPNKDKFAIEIVGSSSDMVTMRELRSGNIKIHKSQSDSASLVAGAGEGILPSGTSLNGVNLSAVHFGKGVLTSGNGSALGDFHTLLLGTSILGQPQNIDIQGPASNGSKNPDGSVTFSGLGILDMGDGTPALTGVPFSVTATTQGLTLTIGLTALPTASLSGGHITIE
jgi:hypothetical protein